MTTWYEAWNGTITEVDVLHETPQKVKVRAGGATYYKFKTSVGRDQNGRQCEWQWIRRDREEAKRLMAAELSRKVAEAKQMLREAESDLQRGMSA